MMFRTRGLGWWQFNHNDGGSLLGRFGAPWHITNSHDHPGKHQQGTCMALMTAGTSGDFPSTRGIGKSWVWVYPIEVAWKAPADRLSKAEHRLFGLLGLPTSRDYKKWAHLGSFLQGNCSPHRSSQVGQQTKCAGRCVKVADYMPDSKPEYLSHAILLISTNDPKTYPSNR